MTYQHDDTRHGWRHDRFVAFLDLIHAERSYEPSSYLLAAYHYAGPSPSSEDLQALCGFADTDAWREALRVSKQRLTILARQMRSPSMFSRAVTERGERHHPMKPLLWEWFDLWVNLRSEEAELSAREFLPNPARWGWKPETESTYETSEHWRVWRQQRTLNREGA